MPGTRIALVAEYNPDSPTHRLTENALCHAARRLEIECELEWCSTADTLPDALRAFDGVWIGPGSPYKSLPNTLQLIRHCREQQLPCLGTCGGFQHMVIEYARTLLGIAEAAHEEYDPSAAQVIVSRLACSLAGREMDLTFAPNSMAAQLYGATTARESYYCNFGINPAYVQRLRAGEFHPTGSDSEGEIRVMEIANHPFFLGTLYLPQARSTEETPHPIVTGFLCAALGSRQVAATPRTG